ncbi:MAG: methylmalonyl-CoA mutase, partial [bacterium]|nr:methylmalonyl-CoA mutase [bacterium]
MMTDSNSYAKSKKEWEETTLKQTLERRAEQKEKFITTSSRPIERLYTPTEDDPTDYMEKLNLPGQYPYTRG